MNFKNLFDFYISNRFLKGLTFGYLNLIATIVVSLFLIPFTLSFLTKPEYGVFAIFADLMGWLSISGLGVSQVLASKSAQLFGEGKKNEITPFASTTFFTQLFSSILIILFTIYLILNPSVIVGDSDFTENISLVIFIIFSGFLINYICQPITVLLVADKQVHIDNFLKFILLLIQTSITIFLLLSGFKLLALAISSFCANLLICLIYIIRVFVSLKEIKFKFSYWDSNIFKYIISKGLWFTVGGLAGLFLLRMDAFLIGKYISLSLVTSFVLNLKLYFIADKVFNTLFNIMRPYVANIYGSNNKEKLTKIYEWMLYTSFLVTLTSGFFIFIITEPFITLWVGSEFYLGDDLNLLLFLNYIFQGFVLPNRIFLASTLYKISLHNLTRILDGVIKFIFSILYISEYGIKALLISSILSSLLISNIFLNKLIQRYLNTYFSYMLYIILIILISLLIISNSFSAITLILAAILMTLLLLLKKYNGLKNYISTSKYLINEMR